MILAPLGPLSLTKWRGSYTRVGTTGRPFNRAVYLYLSIATHYSLRGPLRVEMEALRRRSIPVRDDACGLEATRW